MLALRLRFRRHYGTGSLERTAVPQHLFEFLQAAAAVDAQAPFQVSG